MNLKLGDVWEPFHVRRFYIEVAVNQVLALLPSYLPLSACGGKTADVMGSFP